jgi:site-specific DNA-methyltransferase (adenine-specific)
MDQFLNKVINGDCIDVMAEIPDDSLDLVLTDPPYSGLNSKSRGEGRFSQAEHHIEFDDMSERAFLLFIKPVFRELYRILKVGGHLYCFTDWKQLRNMADCLELCSFKIVNLICWDKGHFGTGAGYRSQSEYVLVFSKGVPNTFNLRNVGNVIKESRVRSNSHPHQKPEKLVEILIKNSTNEGGVVLDPFLGSGTTAVSCKELKRNFIGIEISREYCDVARNRLGQKTLFSNPPLS